jgi:hypothetical protein
MDFLLLDQGIVSDGSACRWPRRACDGVGAFLLASLEVDGPGDMRYV